MDWAPWPRVALNVPAVAAASWSAWAVRSIVVVIWLTLVPTSRPMVPSRSFVHQISPKPIAATTSATIP